MKGERGKEKDGSISLKLVKTVHIYIYIYGQSEMTENFDRWGNVPEASHSISDNEMMIFPRGESVESLSSYSKSLGYTCLLI